MQYLSGNSGLLLQFPPFSEGLDRSALVWESHGRAHFLLYHWRCVMLLTDMCGWQDEKCASPNDGRGGFTNRVGQEACKWMNGGWIRSCRLRHADSKASLRMRRGLRSCPPQRVVGSPAMVSHPDSRMMRSRAARKPTPPSVLHIHCFLHIVSGLIPGTQNPDPGIFTIPRRISPGFPGRDEFPGVLRQSSRALVGGNHSGLLHKNERSKKM